VIIGQTMFSVRKGTEHRAEHALGDLASILQSASGHGAHRVLRSFGMSPLASALRDQDREAVLGDVHFIFETEWDSIEAHDEFYRTEPVQRVYASLQSILASGPFEVLYEALVEDPQRSSVAI
jgi:heme-degrading monooxygenase HmoA